MNEQPVKRPAVFEGGPSMIRIDDCIGNRKTNGQAQTAAKIAGIIRSKDTELLSSFDS